MNLTEHEISALKAACRQFVYFMLTYFFVFSIYRVSLEFRNKTFGEMGVIENLQFALLAISGIIFTVHACMYKEWRDTSFLLASCCFLASFRELDKFFEHNSQFISWKVGFVFPIAALLYAGKNFEKSVKNILEFIAKPSFFMMCFAVIMILPVAQFIGHRPFVVAVLGDNRLTPRVKEFFEECCESIGYFIIVLASLEYCINTHRDSNNS